MNKNYNNGRAKEYRISKKWRERGWLVIRSAGSHSPFDLIAIKTGKGPAMDDPKLADYVDSPQIVLIQSKGGKSGVRERKKLEPLKLKYDGIYLVRVEVV